MSVPALPATYEWNTLPWRKLERRVFKLQQRIYRASHRGDNRTVHHLQRLLLHSQAARLLAVRRVTQDNQGKRTAGVDGVKAITPPARLHLAAKLTLPTTALPLRRVWIPKPGTTDRRPLGIPTLRDRAQQALAKLALEPEWEAKFEPSSYGFRPGRSAHDAIGVIFQNMCAMPKFVLDADIRKCFDRIAHEPLLAKLQTFPLLRRAIRAWLKAGVLDQGTLFPTEEGTPQGGIISPLLANIALHGMEAVVATVQASTQRQRRIAPRLVRYADDFIVTHERRDAVDEVRQRLEHWLRDLGLELHPEKTRVVHTLNANDGSPPGFTFLGFSVRLWPVGKTHQRKRQGGQGRLPYKLFIRPSKESRTRHHRDVNRTIRAHRGASQSALIVHLNPKIRGWANYYRTVASKKTFHTLDHHLYWALWRWGKRRHPEHRTTPWLLGRYWSARPLRFRDRSNGVALSYHSDIAIQRQVVVRPEKSPFDGDWVYWSARLGRSPLVPYRVAQLLRAQRGRCRRCGLYFRAEDRLEIDHILPRAEGGLDHAANRQLLHRHCHDGKTADDVNRRRGTAGQLPD